MKTINVITLLCLTLISVSFAHVDDSGDIHPIVSVENGHFSVYFQNKQDEQKLKMIFQKDGKVVKNREVIKNFPIMPAPIKLPEEQTGINIPQPDAFYVIPEWSRKHDGKPFIFRIKDGNKTRINLTWNDIKIEEVHDATISNKFYILSASKIQPEDRDGYEPFPFYIYVFSKKTQEIHKMKPIGNPIRVYDFPRSSEILFNKGQAYLSWMGIDANQKVVLNLSQFDVETGNVVTKRVSEGHGNSSPSIGIIDDKMIIAFHKPKKQDKDSYFGEEAEIIIKHLKLNTFFPTKMPSIKLEVQH